jgi:hypothetical protein
VQVLTMTIALAAAVWGLNRVYYARHPVLSLLMNSFWCLYNFGLLSTVFYFNQAEETTPEPSEPALLTISK